MMITVSRDIAGLVPYVPGRPIEEVAREMGVVGVIKLASNENPYGPSPKAVAAIRDRLRRIQRYPDGGAVTLREALAERWKVSPKQVTVGNGSNEIIELLVRTFLLPGDEVVMAHPSFSVYRSMVIAAHGRPVEIPLRDGRHDLDRMAKAVTPKTRLIFICNPNNPTGTIVSHREMQRFLSAVPKRILVVVDEAYADFATDTQFPQSIQFLQEGFPLVILRTFSKVYGLAGLRIGYGIGGMEVTDYINRVRQPFNTNLLAQHAALAALTDESHVARTLANNQEGKEYLCREFEQLRMAYLPSEANFIYFDLPGSDPAVGVKVYMALLQRGVIIRHMEGIHMRVTIGLPKENRMFIRAFKEVCAQIFDLRTRPEGGRK